MDAPRLRTDLVAKPIDEAGHHFVDVTDPKSGSTFRFYEVEYSIATALNGRRDVGVLANWAQAELGLQADPGELQSVIDKLGELGYLDLTPLPRGPALPAPPVDDLSLGQAGATAEPRARQLPMPADLQLGSAGKSDGDHPEEATFVAPRLSLGKAGNQKLAPNDFSNLLDDDDVPTNVRRPNQVASKGPASDPSIPPRPPTDQPPVASLTPVGSPDDDDEGPTNLPAPATDFDDEMSVDLTDHMHLGPEAVKEAVRQSQMIAVVKPEDLEPEAAPPPVETKPPAKPPTTPAAEKPIELPKQPPAKVSKPVEPIVDKPVGPPPPEPQPKSRTALLVAILFLGLIVIFAAAVVFNLFDLKVRLGLAEKEAETKPVKKPAVDPNNKPDIKPPPKKPKLPAAKLVDATGPGVEIKATSSGKLASIVETGAEVEADGEVARLTGGESIDRKIANVTIRLNHYQGKLDKALAEQKKASDAGNANAAKNLQKSVDKATKKVEEKRKLIEAEQAKLVKFSITSPSAGTIETELKAGDKVEADAVIAKISGPALLQATFKLPADKKVAEGEEVEVVSKADDKKRLGCAVTKLDGANATVECPTDGGLSAGDDVVLPL